MRDLAVLAAIAGVLPFALLRPWIGVLAWIVVSVAAPHQLTWSLSHQPVAQAIAVTTLAGFLLFREGARSLPMRAPVVLVLALWAWALVTSLTAVYPDAAWARLVEVSKMLAFTLVALSLFQDLRRIRVLLAVLVGTLGFFAVKGTLFTVLTGGQHIVYGPANTSFYDNNDLALGLNMLLPLAIFVARSQPRGARRWIWGGVAACTALAVLFTYSRGGAVALAAVLGVTVLRSRQRVPALVVCVVVALALVLLAPPQLMERFGTIRDYEQDASANARFNAWRFSWNVARAHPITGGGFGVFTPEMYAIYAPEEGAAFVAHSVYFQAMATQGFVGLGLFVALAVVTLWRAGRLRARALQRGATFFAGAAEAVQLGLVGFLVGGAFLSQNWNELFFYLVASQVLLEVTAEPVLALEEEASPLWRQRQVEPCAA